MMTMKKECIERQLQSFVADIEAMSKGDFFFGPFDGAIFTVNEDNDDEFEPYESLTVAWPHLKFLLDEAKKTVQQGGEEAMNTLKALVEEIRLQQEVLKREANDDEDVDEKAFFGLFAIYYTGGNIYDGGALIYWPNLKILAEQAERLLLKEGE